MTDIPAPGSPEEVALMSRAIDQLGGPARPLVPRSAPVHPAYQPTRPNPKSVGPQGELFKRAVNAAWLAHTRGEPVTADTILIYDAALPKQQLLELLETPLFRQALGDRGIPTTDDHFLTEAQVTALAIIADHSIRKPERQKLRMAGINWNEFQGWLSNPSFRRQYRAIHERALVLATERGDTVLAQLIDDGNMRAIEYANAMTGKYDPASREALQVMSILRMVMSVVQKHVTDEVTLLALSEDFEKVAAQGGLQQLEIIDAEVVDSAN